MPSKANPAKIKKLTKGAAKRLHDKYNPPPPPEPKIPKGKITITLTRQHSVNNEFYGPGQVTVSRDLAALLREQERNAAAEEQAFHDSEPAARLLLGRGRSMRMPSEQLEPMMVFGPVAGIFSGKF